MKENIPGYPGYHVTRDGKVYSCLIQGGSSKRGPWKLRYTAITKTGHEQIRLRTPTGFRSKGVHRLVALAYIPNPNGKPEVCHKDNNPTNDYYKNLYWGTHKENLHQMIRDGRWYTPFTKESNPNKGKRGWQLNTSLNEQQFRSILKLKEAGYTNTVIIQKLGLTKISSSGISRIWKKYKVGYYDEVLKL